MESDIGLNLTQTGCESAERIEVGHDITHRQRRIIWRTVRCHENLNFLDQLNKVSSAAANWWLMGQMEAKNDQSAMPAKERLVPL